MEKALHDHYNAVNAKFEEIGAEFAHQMLAHEQLNSDLDYLRARISSILNELQMSVGPLSKKLKMPESA